MFILRGLQSYIIAKLPDYMLPSAWIFLDAMPLTPNNQVDRRTNDTSGKSPTCRSKAKTQLTILVYKLTDLEFIFSEIVAAWSDKFILNQNHEICKSTN